MKRFGLFVASMVAAVGLSISANAASVITNGTVTLGVDDLGQLIIPGPASPTGTLFVGLRHNLNGNECRRHDKR